MEVIPAIDIRGGKCVRLYQGDYERETVFSDSPARMAAHWASEGASRIHIVDLDGAKAGAPVHAELVAGIAESVPVSTAGQNQIHRRDSRVELSPSTPVVQNTSGCGIVMQHEVEERD